MISKAINLKNVKHAKARLTKLSKKKTFTKKDIAEVKRIIAFEKKAIGSVIKKTGKPLVGSRSKTATSVYKKAGIK